MGGGKSKLYEYKMEYHGQIIRQLLGVDEIGDVIGWG